MKALTLTQPWATLVAIGAKQIETRSWGTRYRGPLAIHAAKGFPREAQMLCIREPFYSVLGPDIWPERTLRLPRGVVIATVDLVDCRSTSPTVHDAIGPKWVGQLSAQECAFGDFDAGRWGWFFENLRVLPEPMPARGSLGLWEWQP